MVVLKWIIERELGNNDGDKSRDLGRQVILEDGIKFNY